MRQKTFSSIGFDVHHKLTLRDKFLGEMEVVVPWSSLCAQIEPHYPSGERGRPPIGIERMLRILSHQPLECCQRLWRQPRRPHPIVRMNQKLDHPQ